MNLDQFKEARNPLFSIHNHSDGSIALYLEEQDAVKDLVQDIVGAYPLDDLDLLRHSADRSVKSDGYFEHLDNARDNLSENAPLLCSREAGTTYPSLKAVK
jgi:hypothetical protein